MSVYKYKYNLEEVSKIFGLIYYFNLMGWCLYQLAYNLLFEILEFSCLLSVPFHI